MIDRNYVQIVCIVSVLAIAGQPTGAFAQSEEQIAVSGAEVTADGLHRVDPAILPSTWLLPDVALSRYTPALVMPTFTLFRELPQTSSNAWKDRSRSAFEVGENMKERLRVTFGEAFHDAMAR